MSDSETPRVDKYIDSCTVDKGCDILLHIVSADFARQLETELIAAKAEVESFASDITKEQANELQDILRTLTNSGSALITSARELTKCNNYLVEKRAEAENELATAKAENAALRKVAEAARQLIESEYNDNSFLKSETAWHKLHAALDEVKK